MSKDPGKSARPIDKDGTPIYQCADCGSYWRMKDLAIARDLHQRFEDGDRVSHYECPDKDCGAMCFPADGEPVRLLRGHKGGPLEKHLYHEMIVQNDGGDVVMSCQTCGNQATRIVEESELAKLEDADDAPEAPSS